MDEIREIDIPLPYDVKIGATLFRKGVSLGTLINAARRWQKQAQEAFEQSNKHTETRVVSEQPVRICPECDIAECRTHLNPSQN